MEHFNIQELGGDRGVGSQVQQFVHTTIDFQVPLYALYLKHQLK